MAENDSEKTEEPTGKRKADARKKGQVAKSADLSSAITLIFAIILLWVFAKYMGTRLHNVMIETFLSISTFEMTAQNLIYFSQSAIKFFAILVLPMLLIALVVGIFSNIIQFGFLFSGELLKPKFGKVFGISAFKKLVSPDKFVELLKSLAKMAIVAVIVFQVIHSHYESFLYTVDESVFHISLTILKTLLEMAIKVAILLIVLGVLDFFYQKYKTHKELKMTKQEVKDEAKQADGDPKIKGKIRSLRMEMHRKMMMNEVPKATVVVTNPTFIAIAIRYNPAMDRSPVIVAKGKRIMAEKIKKIAIENNIPIVEDKPLARGMFDLVQPGQEIPYEFFGPVAEILAYVYNLKGGKIPHEV